MSRPRAAPPNRRLIAPMPCDIADVHPSVRGDRPATMKAWLSTYEFRAYKKKTGKIALHMRSILLVRTTVSFSSFAYLKNITGTLAVPPDHRFDLDGIAIAEDCDIRYDGETMGMDLWISVPTDLDECQSCLGHIDLRFCFVFAGAPIEARIKHDVTVRRIRRRNET